MRAPDWIERTFLSVDQDASTAHGGIAIDVEDLVDSVVNAPQGKRNETLNKASFELGMREQQKGVCPDARLQLRRAAIDAGLTAFEADRTLESGTSAGHQADARPARAASTRQVQVLSKLVPEPYRWVNPGHIPRRDWLLGRILIRKFCR